MKNAKPDSTPLANHFKLRICVPRHRRRQNTCCQLNVCHGVHKTKYCTRSGSCEQVYEYPSKEHWKVVQWILRYLRGTTFHALCLGGLDTVLQGYVDADMASDKDSRRSTIGYVFTVGGIAVSWISKLQQVVALSTTEAEYVAAIEASKEMIWLQRFMEELGKKQESSRLYSDSQSVIRLAKNSIFHLRTKHIELKYHFIRSVLDEELLKLDKIHTRQNHADMLTKVVTREKLSSFSVSIGLQA